jgi:hypothetical protein
MQRLQPGAVSLLNMVLEPQRSHTQLPAKVAQIKATKNGSSSSSSSQLWQQCRPATAASRQGVAAGGWLCLEVAEGLPTAVRWCKQAGIMLTLSSLGLH